MKFLAPGAFIFTISLLVILLFYILKKKRVEHRISSTILWDRFLSETQANSPFQKLRKHILMFIQMLLALLIVLALTRPFFEGKQTMYGLNVVIIDASASMLSTDVRPNRFEQSKLDAKKLIESLEPGARAILVRMGSTTEIAQTTTTQQSLLISALDNLKPSHGPASVDEAFQLAESLIKNPTATINSEEGFSFIPGARIHLFSDGGLGSLEELATKNLPISYYPIGVSGTNLAITSTDIRSSAIDPKLQSLFVEVKNFSTNKTYGILSVSFEGSEIGNKALELDPKASGQSIFNVRQEKNGKYEIQLSCDDDLQVDNKSWIISKLPSAVKVLMVSPGNAFLEKAISGIEGVELTIEKSFPKKLETKFDTIVVDRVSPPTEFKNNHCLWINTQPVSWFNNTSVIEAPIATSYNQTHPVFRFVSLDQILIARSQKVKLPYWGSTILQATETPLVFEGEINGTKQLWIGFDLLESSWPREVSFPIFITNAINWLSSRSSEKSNFNKRTGDNIEFRIDSGSEIQSTTALLPNGDRVDLEFDEDTSQIYLSQTEIQGVYEINFGIDSVEVAVNAQHGSESDITPASSLELGDVTTIPSSSVATAQMEIWRWLALAVFIFFGFEWWYFHKRTV